MLDLSDPAGKAKITDDDGHTVVLRRPKWKHLEALRFKQSELAEREQAAAKEVRAISEAESERLKATKEQVEAGTYEADDEGDLEHNMGVHRRIAEISRQSAEGVAGWWDEVIKLLAENADDWPADWEEWPGWMLEGPGVIGTLIAYWRTVPLDRGSMGRQVSEPGNL